MIPVEDIKKRFGTETGLVILVLRIYFRKETPQALAAYLQGGTINWDFFCQLIFEYEIRPVIYKVLSAHQAGVDPDTLARLRQDCFQLAAASLEKAKEILRLQTLLRGQGITSVPYKGAFLSRFLFGDFITRETRDIDFLIYPSDTIKVTRLLLAEGYRTDFYYDEQDEDYIVKVSCERSFYKTDQQGRLTSVEIHWQLLPPSFDVPLQNAELLQHLEVEQVYGKEVNLLNTSFNFLSLITHHGVNDVWRTLKHVVDLGTFVEHKADSIDWEWVRKKTGQLKIKKALETGFYLADDLLGIDPPPGYKLHRGKDGGRVLENLLAYPMLTKLKYSWKHFSQHLALRDNRMHQLKLVVNSLKLLFMPTANDLKSLRLPSALFFLYYFIKPFRLLQDRL
ncbi:nucleotidyltransferase family protein [Paraflavisolibacter sp. H34]|uniref:nucleotidyltransferase domain-containing protein n=1 Tax=Huijunlia imazamoxiresistens TaxID=3127457 RepID=UPI003017D478